MLTMINVSVTMAAMNAAMATMAATVSRITYQPPDGASQRHRLS